MAIFKFKICQVKIKQNIGYEGDLGHFIYKNRALDLSYWLLHYGNLPIKNALKQKLISVICEETAPQSSRACGFMMYIKEMALISPGTGD